MKSIEFTPLRFRLGWGFCETPIQEPFALDLSNSQTPSRSQAATVTAEASLLENLPILLPQKLGVGVRCIAQDIDRLPLHSSKQTATLAPVIGTTLAVEINITQRWRVLLLIWGTT